MTDIGEAVSVLLGGPAKDECPFCDAEEEEPELEEKEIINDSAQLARNSGGMPRRRTANPDCDKDYHIFDKYWVSNATSRIAFNAHHLIPGNASLAKSKPIRKWMAGTTVVKKKFYDSVIELQVAKSPESKQASNRAALVKKKYKTEKLLGPIDAVITYRTVGKKKAIHRDNTVATEHVTGQIDYDQNGVQNNAWLPSNNAIADWGAVKSAPATDEDGNADSFNACYAYNTMMATGWQFHDAHPAYSTEVKNRLNGLEMEVKKLANGCIDHEESQANENDGKPFPAPHRLTGALYRLSSCFKKRLKVDIESGKTPKSPWLTSDLSEQW